MSANKCVKGHNHSDLCYVVAIELIELNALVAVGDKTTYLEIGIWTLRFALCDFQMCEMWSDVDHLLCY